MNDKAPQAETISFLTQQVDLLTKQISSLTAEVKTLKGKLSKNSNNSSKPPSSDGYSKPAPKSLRKKSGKPSGGQSGHKGHTLQMVDKPDVIVEHKVTACTHCCADLSRTEVIDIERRQVFDLPPITLQVTEHQAQIKQCTVCGEKNKASFATGVQKGTQYGTQIQALLTYFSQYQLLPYLRTQEVFQDLFNIKLSQGTISNVLSRGTNGLQQFTEQLKAALLIILTKRVCVLIKNFIGVMSPQMNS